MTLEIESDPLSLIHHFGFVFCFVGMMHCDLAGGITQMQMQSCKMSLLKDFDKFRSLEGSFANNKLSSRQGRVEASKFKETEAKQLRG